MESFLLNLIAFVFALGMCFSVDAHGLINSPGRYDNISFFICPANYWLGFLAMFLAGSLLSGIYPAFVLSGFQPVTVLKGLFKNSQRWDCIAKMSYHGQFATSVVLIAGTIIVFQQVSYMRKQKLGVNINQTLVLDGAESITDSVYQNSFSLLKLICLKIPGVKNVAASSSVMGKEIYWTNGSRQLAPR